MTCGMPTTKMESSVAIDKKAGRGFSRAIATPAR